MFLTLLRDICIVIGLYGIGYSFGYIGAWVYDLTSHPYVSTFIKYYNEQQEQYQDQTNEPDEVEYIINKTKVEDGFIYQIRIFGMLVFDIQKQKQNVFDEQHKRRVHKL